MAYQFMIKEKKGQSEAFIYLRYSYKESECLISTGKKINVNHWDKEKCRPGKSFPGGKTTIEKFLTSFKGKVVEAATQLENEGELPLPDEVKKRYLENNSGIIRGATRAVDQWEQFIKDGEGQKESATIIGERGSLKAFTEFLESINKPSITLRRINKELIKSYEKYLAGKYADNTKARHLKKFKAFLKAMKHTETDEVKFKEHAGDKIYLTAGELEAIENYPLEPNTTRTHARDLLSLQCETGLRVSDLMRLGPGHIQGAALLIRAKKNDELIRMPISAKIREILTRYNHKIPKMADQTYNEEIKEIAKLAITDSKVEITERRGGVKTIKTCLKSEVLSSHACVRTFINLAAARGMPVVSIAALTGKSVQTLLKSYLKPNVEQAYQDAITYGRVPMAVNR